MIVDAHLHIWKKIHGQVNGQIPVVPLGKGMIRIGKNKVLGLPPYHLDGSNPAEWVLATFDAFGVDVGIIVQEYLDGEQNDYLLRVARRYPDRFFMHGLPNFFAVNQVARESSRLFRRGFRGIKLPAMHLAATGIPLNHAAFMPIWEEMEEKGYVLAVDLATGADQVPQMEGILAHCPQLRVAIGHFGMVTRGDWIQQIRLARHAHVYVETGGIIWLFRKEGYPFRGATKAIQRAKREVGVKKLMWGSDWPRTMIDFAYRQAIEFVRQEPNGFTKIEKRLLLGENAARLYRLCRPSAKRFPSKLVTEG